MHSTNSMYFIVDNDNGGHPTWWLRGGNHELVAWAGESFASISNAERAAAAFKAGASIARYEPYKDWGGHWRWRAWRSSDKVASSGQTFDGRYEAQSAANRVRDNAGSASLPSRTR